MHFKTVLWIEGQERKAARQKLGGTEDRRGGKKAALCYEQRRSPIYREAALYPQEAPACEVVLLAGMVMFCANENEGDQETHIYLASAMLWVLW